MLGLSSIAWSKSFTAWSTSGGFGKKIMPLAIRARTRCWAGVALCSITTVQADSFWLGVTPTLARHRRNSSDGSAMVAGGGAAFGGSAIAPTGNASVAAITADTMRMRILISPVGTWWAGGEE